jgi:transcriptional repressor NrdR
VKKDGSRVPYDRNKIKTGLEKACWKRPISDEQIEAIVTAIEDDIEKNFESEVESRYIGELAMKHLRDLDQVAYVRFASVYRQFEDVHDFMEEVRPMLNQGKHY